MLGESTIYLHHTCNTGVVSQTYVLLTKLFQAKMLPINKQTVTTCSETQELIYRFVVKIMTEIKGRNEVKFISYCLHNNLRWKTNLC